MTRRPPHPTPAVIAAQLERTAINFDVAPPPNVVAKTMHEAASLIENYAHHCPADPDFTPEQLVELLRRTANRMVDHADKLKGHPLLAQPMLETFVASHAAKLYEPYLKTLDLKLGDLVTPKNQSTETRPTGHFATNAGTFVYMAYDNADQLLYVGVTDDLWARMSQHRRTSRWWDLMEHLDWEEMPDREMALRKETKLIGRHRPPFNVVGNPDAKRPK